MDTTDLWRERVDDLFTTSFAASRGIGERELRRGVASGAVRHLARGLYACGPAPVRSEDRHRELCRGLLLLYPDGVLSGRSSVVAHGLPVWNVPLGEVLLLRRVASQVRRSGAVIRPLETPTSWASSDIGPCEPLATALVQLAIDHGAPSAVVSADAALARRLVAHDDLTEEVEARRGHPRCQRARALLSFADAKSESPGESRLRFMLASFGIDVVSQVVVRDGDSVVARADLGVRGTRVLIEFDGAVKYREGGAEALMREKRREDRLRALGYIVLRFTWADLESPRAVLAAVRAAVARDLALQFATS